jgi:ataxin-10
MGVPNGVCDHYVQVLTAVLARDQDAAAGVKPGKDTEAAAAAGLAATAQHLHSLGLMQQLLQMLTAMGPPPKTKQQQQRELEEQQQRQQQGQSQQVQQGTEQPPAQQHQQPYAGYRADVLAVLSNLLLGGQQVQDALMASGGIELLLNNTNLDESSPMAREWALWGIRNACKDNAGVQGYVAQFQAVDAVQSPELDKMGMQLELDQMTHKLKLSKKQQDTQ